MAQRNRPPVLVRDFAGRILNVSKSGCLIESRRPFDVGVVGRLTVTIGPHPCADDVEVLRCDPVEGTHGRYHVAVRFLWTTPRVPGSIRHVAALHADDEESARPTWVM